MANFKDILKQRRQSGTSLTTALTSSAYDVSREKYDPINALFKTGTFLNALFPKMSGFKASSSSGVSKVSPTKLSMSGDNISKDKLDMISEYSKISAKNSTALPTMARDMFLVKENIVKLVKLQKGTPRTKAGDWLSRQAAREQAFESKFSLRRAISDDKKSGGDKAGSCVLGGLGSSTKSIFGLGGTILGGIGSLLGSVGGTIFKMIGLSLVTLGPLGLVLSGLLGYILYRAVKTFDFDKMKEDFSKVYNDVTSGIKSFFNIDSEEGLFSGLIGGLDKAFGTSVFSEMAEYVKLTFELIKLDFQDFFTESTFIFESILEEVKKLATSVLVGLGISAGAGAALALSRRAPKLAAGATAAGAAATGAAATSATASSVGKIVAKNAGKIGGAVALRAGAFTAGLFSGPLGWALSAYLVYDSYDTISDIVSLFTGVSDADIKKLVEEGQLSEEEADIIIKGRAAQERLDKLKAGSESFSRQLELSEKRNMPAKSKRMRQALEDNERRIQETQEEIRLMNELLGKPQGEDVTSKGPEIKRDLNLAKTQSSREALMKQRSAVGQKIQRNLGFGEQKPGTDGSPTSLGGSNTQLIEFLKQKENPALAKEKGTSKAYWDYQQYSIGYGTKANSPDEVITEAEAERRLIAEVEKSKKIVLDFSKKHNYDWNSNQVDSLTSFIYNLGPGALNQVTGNGKRTNHEIAAAMPKYNQAGGQVLPGLVSRRNIETAMFENSAPRMPAAAVAAASTSYGDTMRQSSVPSVNVNAPTTNNNVQGSGRQQSPSMAPASVVDTEFMKLLVGRTVGQ